MQIQGDCLKCVLSKRLVQRIRYVLKGTAKHYTSFEHTRWVLLSVVQSESLFAMAVLQQALKVTLDSWTGAVPVDAAFQAIFHGLSFSLLRVRNAVTHHRLQLGSVIESCRGERGCLADGVAWPTQYF